MDDFDRIDLILGLAILVLFSTLPQTGTLGLCLLSGIVGFLLVSANACKDSVATAGISLGGQQARCTARLPPHGFAHPLHEIVAVSEALASLFSEGVQELPDLDACNEIA